MIRKIILIVLTLIFLLFAYLQLNDPDSLRWACYYLILAMLILLNLFGKSRLMFIGVTGVFTLVYLAILFPTAMEWIKEGMPSITESMKAESPYIEKIREFLGLAIGLVLLIGLFFDRKGRPRTTN